MQFIVTWKNDIDLDRMVEVHSNDTDEMRQVHQRAEQAEEIFRSWATERGTVIAIDTTGGTVEIPASNITDLPRLAEQYAGKVDARVGVGVGTNLYEAHVACEAALKREHGGVLLYSEELEQGEEAAKKQDPLALLAENVDGVALEKGVRDIVVGAVAGAALAASPMAAEAKEPKPVVSQQQQAPVKKWSADTLHKELWPIAHLESSFGKNTGHAKHSKGEFHTAFGALGLKPITAYEEYMRTKDLQAKHPGLKDQGAFLNKFRSDPDFYNEVAGVHWERIKRLHKGNLARSAYSWRYGPTAALRASPETIASDYYPTRYFKIAKDIQTQAGLDKAERWFGLFRGAHAGMQSRHHPVRPAPPIEPKEEASEHTQGEAAQALVEEEGVSPESTAQVHEATHPDIEDELHSFAEEQSKNDEEQDAAAQEQKEREEIKQTILQTLEQLKEQAPLLESIQKRNPELYTAITGVVQAMIGLSKKFLSVEDPQQAQQEELIQKFESLTKMALADIPVGKRHGSGKVPAILSSVPNKEIFNYSHVLPEGRQKDYRILVGVVPQDDKCHISAMLTDPKLNVLGSVGGELFDGGRLNIVSSEIKDPAIRNMGLGSALYESLMAHSKNALGATKVFGGYHSTLASMVHRRLARKHGLEYESKESLWHDDNEPGPYDNRYGGYEYALKNESSLNKMALSDIPVGREAPPEEYPPWAVGEPTDEKFYDYSHILPEHAKDHKLFVGIAPASPTKFRIGAYVVDPNNRFAGKLQGAMYSNDKSFRIDVSDLNSRFQGKGLGSALYESALVHAKNAMGAKIAYGGIHSSLASMVHRRLARKHGLDYKAKPNIGPDAAYRDPEDFEDSPNEPFDDKYLNYRYALKSEDEGTVKKNSRIPTVVRRPSAKKPIVLPSGSTKQGEAADATPSHRSGQIKVTENGEDRWRQVRSGMVRNPSTGEAVSSLTVPKERKQPDAGNQ